MKIYEETDNYIVVHKPAGLATQTSKMGQKDLISEVKNYLADNKQSTYVAVINRLDQPVEGLVLLAKNEKTAANLSKQLTEGRIEKIYQAKVCGIIREKGHLENYMIKDGKTNLSRIVKEGTKDAKKAILEYEVIETGKESTLLKVHLITGRHHQIRLQMSHAGYPILGDKKYGTAKSVEVSERESIKNVCLKAVSLEFTEPGSNNKVKFVIDEY